MSVFEPANQETGASDDNQQTSLWTYGEEVSERSEDWLPRTADCDCDRIHCFHNIDYDALDARVEEVKDISEGPQ